MFIRVVTYGKKNKYLLIGETGAIRFISSELATENDRLTNQSTAISIIANLFFCYSGGHIKILKSLNIGT